MILRWLIGKALGLFTGEVGSIAESIGNSISKYHASTTEAAAVKATVHAHAREIETETRAALLASWARNTRWFVADAVPFIVWVCGIALALVLLPQATLTAWYWSVSVISTGTLQPFPDEINLWHIISMGLGAAGIGAAKALGVKK